MNSEMYIFNPYYRLLADDYSAILKSRSGWISENQDLAESDFSVRLHPVHAVLFSMFDGKTQFDNIISKATTFFEGFEPKELATHLRLFFENEKRIGLKYAGAEFLFPKNILIPMKSEYEKYQEEYHPEQFLISPEALDFEKQRLSHPTLLLWVVNTICYTNCYYCYANRKRKMQCMIPVPRLLKMIEEAKMLGVEGIDITGGEFFLYPQWEIILAELVRMGYSPYISTKVPLTEETIRKIKKTGLEGFQVSLDSVDPVILSQTLKTGKGYIEAIENMFRIASKYKLIISVHSIITKATANAKNLQQLFRFLSQFDNIRNVKIDTAARSLYLSQNTFEEYRLNASDIQTVFECVMDIKQKANIPYLFAIESNKPLLVNSKTEKARIFNARGKCSGNTEAIVILPDGNVTICEELYWNEKFNIGNINEQSIEEIWNSQKALKLYNLGKEMIDQHSACKYCQTYDTCRKGAGVCWRDIVNSYGENNWSYPDPRCPQAPPIINDIIYGH